MIDFDNADKRSDNNCFNWPMISVVLPVRNEDKFIGQTLKYLLNQDYPHDKLEILVVDGQSTDRTRDVVEGIAAYDSRVKLIDNQKCLSSAARNIGAKAAHGDIVSYIDGHIHIDNDQLLKNTALLMRERAVSALSRPQFLDTPQNDYFQQAVSLARKSVFGHGLDSTIYSLREEYVDPTSSGASYTKNVFEKIGYFDENFDAAEDVEFNYRVGKGGFVSFTSPKLAVNYYPRKDLKGLFRQMTRYGTGRFRFLQKHHEAISSGALIPPLYFIGLAILIVSALLTGLARPILLAYAGAYILVNLASSVAVASRNGWKYFYILPLIYFCVHGGLAWGFISGAARAVLVKSEKKLA